MLIRSEKWSQISTSLSILKSRIATAMTYSVNSTLSMPTKMNSQLPSVKLYYPLMLTPKLKKYKSNTRAVGRILWTSEICGSFMLKGGINILIKIIPHFSMFEKRLSNWFILKSGLSLTHASVILVNLSTFHPFITWKVKNKRKKHSKTLLFTFQLWFFHFPFAKWVYSFFSTWMRILTMTYWWRPSIWFDY